MATDDSKQPKTLDELEQELDKEELKPEIVAVESQDDQPPDPRAPGESADTTPRVSDDELRSAADATEEQNDDDAVPADQSLHVENRPHARQHFWKRKKFWLLTIATLIVALALAWLISPSRLWLVNLVGLRTTVTITTATAASDDQPSALVKNVTIECNGVPVQTNEQGVASATVPYGEVRIETKKQGYSPVVKTVFLDFDPFFYWLGGRQEDEKARVVSLQLQAVGTALKFTAIDWLTDKPLTVGAFHVGDIVARPDKQGVVSLQVPATEEKEVLVKSALGGAYVDQDFTLSLAEGDPRTVAFVPAGKTYFISQRSGAPAVYSSNLDGGGMQEVLKAGPSETAAMNFTISPSGKFGVLISTRDGKRDDQGTLLQRLYIMDTATRTLKLIDEGQWFTFIDWSGDWLVYAVGERLSGASGATQRLASVDVTKASQKTLSTASSFGAWRVALGSLVYLKNFAADEEGADNGPELRVVPVKGGTEKTLGNKVQQLVQTDADKVAYQTTDGVWHGYNINTAKAASASAPSSASRAFLAGSSVDGQHRLVLEKIDGQPTILVKNVASGEERKLYGAAGLQGPIRWAGNVIVFRIVDGGQIADYALSIAGGEPKKITDVTQPLTTAPVLANYLTFF